MVERLFIWDGTRKEKKKDPVTGVEYIELAAEETRRTDIEERITPRVIEERLRERGVDITDVYAVTNEMQREPERYGEAAKYNEELRMMLGLPNWDEQAAEVDPETFKIYLTKEPKGILNNRYGEQKYMSREYLEERPLRKKYNKKEVVREFNEEPER